MRRTLLDFLIMFFAVISVHSLRRLHAIGQPISDITIDAVGMSSIYAFLFFVFRSATQKSKTRSTEASSAKAISKENG
jgi:predicted alternative tryptophan synthase beta-subunit